MTQRRSLIINSSLIFFYIIAFLSLWPIDAFSTMQESGPTKEQIDKENKLFNEKLDAQIRGDKIQDKMIKKDWDEKKKNWSKKDKKSHKQMCKKTFVLSDKDNEFYDQASDIGSRLPSYSPQYINALKEYQMHYIILNEKAKRQDCHVYQKNGDRAHYNPRIFNDFGGPVMGMGMGFGDGFGPGFGPVGGMW